MIAISKVAESTDRVGHPGEARTLASPHIIQFFAAGEQITTSNSESAPLYHPGSQGESRCHSFNRELSHPYSDPLDDWLYSLITGAALAALLIGILCWPSTSTTKLETSASRPNSPVESYFITQNPD